MIIRSVRFILLALLLLQAAPAPACSSFATYGNGPLYGMNFDYPASTIIRFVIETHGDLKVFQLTFFRVTGFVPTVGMNSAGLFISDQILEGERVKASERKEETIFPGQLYHRVLRECTDVEMVRKFLAKRRLVRSPYVDLHLLIADNSGDALIAEVGKTENALLDIEGDFIVMTNFSHEANLGRDFDDMMGVGANRYRILHEGLEGHRNQLGVDQAFTLLDQAKNYSTDYPTLCSMVFDPERGEVFIALETDYDKIWKVSLTEGTIETYQGFAEHRQWVLDASGILATDLK